MHDLLKNILKINSQYFTKYGILPAYVTVTQDIHNRIVDLINKSSPHAFTSDNHMPQLFGMYYKTGPLPFGVLAAVGPSPYSEQPDRFEPHILWRFSDIILERFQ